MVLQIWVPVPPVLFCTIDRFANPTADLAEKPAGPSIGRPPPRVSVLPLVVLGSLDSDLDEEVAGEPDGEKGHHESQLGQDAQTAALPEQRRQNF